MAQKKKSGQVKKTSASPAPGNNGKKKPARKSTAGKKPLKKKDPMPLPTKQAADSPDKPVAPARKRLVKLKRKMHREIFEKCVEKHFYSGLSNWNEVAIPDKKQEGFPDNSDDDKDSSN